MNSWYFKKEDLQFFTPSRYDGLTTEDENSFRKEGCSFMITAGGSLRFPQLTIATAIVFFQRFFMRYSFKKWDVLMLSTASLFLAGKVEETPKKLKEVLLVSYQVRNKEIPKCETQEFWELKEKVLFHERLLLQTLAFEVTIEHPYKFLCPYVKTINGDRNLAHFAWNLVNQSLRTQICLQFKPQLIATAAIYLASKYINQSINQRSWWTIFGINVDDLEDICNQILELIGHNLPKYEAFEPSFIVQPTKRLQPMSPIEMSASPEFLPPSLASHCVGAGAILDDEAKFLNGNSERKSGTDTSSYLSPSKIPTRPTVEPKSDFSNVNYSSISKQDSHVFPASSSSPLHPPSHHTQRYQSITSSSPSSSPSRGFSNSPTVCGERSTVRSQSQVPSKSSQDTHERDYYHSHSAQPYSRQAHNHQKHNPNNPNPHSNTLSDTHSLSHQRHFQNMNDHRNQHSQHYQSSHKIQHQTTQNHRRDKEVRRFNPY